MRPGRAASPLRAGGGGGEQREQRERGGGLPERPPSPKKRKASYNIDKEFILKDDKVKRNTGAAGRWAKWAERPLHGRAGCGHGRRGHGWMRHASACGTAGGCWTARGGLDWVSCQHGCWPAGVTHQVPWHVLLCLAADTQGDISQARGQLGQLLFEFSQVGQQDMVMGPHDCLWCGVDSDGIRCGLVGCCLLPCCTWPAEPGLPELLQSTCGRPAA